MLGLVRGSTARLSIVCEVKTGHSIAKGKKELSTHVKHQTRAEREERGNEQ